MLASYSVAIAAAAVFLVVLIAAIEFNSRASDSPSGILASIRHVWRQWHDPVGPRPAETIFTLTLFGLPLLAALVAGLFLPGVHRGGEPAASYGRAFRAVISGAGAFLVFLATTGGSIFAAVLISQHSDNWQNGVVFGFLTAAACMAAVCTLLWWVHRATHAVAGALPADPPPMRCESCGYDLAHVPANGLCPECAAPAVDSLDQALSRPGWPWQNASHQFDKWLHACLRVIFRPGAFYRRLRVRSDPSTPGAFSRWTYPIIGIGAALWFLASMSILEPQAGGPACGLSLVILFLAPLAGWFVHRFIGAAASAWAILRGITPDGRWLDRVMDFESAYLLTFCFANGAIINSFMFLEDWVSRLLGRGAGLGRYLIPGLPIEGDLLLFTNLALCLGWIRRYQVAIRGIRWANF